MKTLAIKLSKVAFMLMLISLLLLDIRPTPILAANQSQVTGTTLYLPMVLNLGVSGPSGTLSNGGIFEGAGGVGIGALSDTLAAPIQVAIAVTSPPTNTLPVTAQALGDFYLVSAGEDLSVSPENPFILAFPIPVGADQAHLALATLRSTEDVSDVDEPGQIWTLLEGVVDTNQGRFLTIIAGLKQAGNVFTLVEHPDFDSPPNAISRDRSHSDDNRKSLFDLFTVDCLYFAGSTNCTTITEATIADYLTDIYDHIHQDLGFNEPRLLYMNESLEYNPNSFSSLGYATYIEPVNHGYVQGGCKPGVDGYYEADLGRLVLCYDPVGGITQDTLYTLIHEYFHATQYGYPKVLADYDSGDEERWIIEGMAASSEESYFVNEMLRSNSWNLHEVDVPIKYRGGSDDRDEYRTQDFWVYYGQLNGLDLSYLNEILDEGASSQALVNVLDQPRRELLEVYWYWVKNHVMEPGIDYAGMIGTPCELETQVVLALEQVSFGGYSNTFYDVVLDPLSSIVIDLRWDWDGYTFADGIVFPAPFQDPMAGLALRYKFYEEGEQFCEAVPDRNRIIQNPDPTKRYYLVVSNIDHDNSYTYRIRFEYAPSPPPPTP